MQALTDHAKTGGVQGRIGWRGRRPRRAVQGGLLGASALLCALLVVPGMAEAVSVSYTRADGDHDVTYNIGGGDGQPNNVEVSIVDGQSGGSQVSIEEKSSGASLSVTDPLGLCSESGKETTCLTFLQSGHNDVGISADLGSGNDSYTGPNNRFAWAQEIAFVDGAEHDDTLRATNWPTWLNGGGGNDVLDARNGGSPTADNILTGQGGFDLLRAKNGQIEALIDCGGDGRASIDAGLENTVSCSAGTGDAPSVSIDDGPGAESGAVVNATSAHLVFSSEPGASFECRQYAETEAVPAWTSCISPQDYTVEEGDHVKHTFEVRAKDIVGFTGAVASYEWVVDTFAPNTDVFPLGGVHLTKDSTPELPEFDSEDLDVDHYECRLDGAGPWRVCTSGGQWPGPPLSDGEHTIAIRAVDEAGNPDPDPDEQKYLIDTTPPAVAFDNGQNPSGAETVKAHYTETGSGFQSAQILARLRNSGQEWKALPTTENGGAVSARLDSLKPGVYEFEARVTDKATNVGVSNQTQNGADLVLEITLLGTRVGLGFPGSASGSAALEYGQSGQVTGTLRSTSGNPLAGQNVRLVEHFYAGSAQESRTRTYRTDPRGEISANLPPGPSREVELVYPGAGRYDSSRSEELELDVNGSVSLKAKRKVRAGRKLKFKGLVPHEGALLPAGGKLVEVQVRVGRQWRAVTGSKRTRPNGRYKLKYRFGSFYTRPTRFAFRTKLLTEQGWPFRTPVYSKKRKVKVLPKR